VFRGPHPRQRQLGPMLVTLLAAISGCGPGRAPDATPPPAATHSSPCGEYTQAVADAQQAPGDIEVEVFNACGCPFTVRTTAAGAARIRDKYPEWRRAHCAVNCDTPCSAMVQ
jgi:hypothetical protein